MTQISTNPAKPAYKIIDFHTHSFPDKIASKALSKLSKSANMPYYSDGTLEGLQRSMKESGVSCSILLPVATSPGQQETINRTAAAINEQFDKTGILSFGGIHPDNENYRDILRFLSSCGIKGVKLHPVFQGAYLDDVRYLRIIECACEYGLIVITHAGFDVGFPGVDFSVPKHIRAMLDAIHPDKMVLAHMGGWGCFDEIEEQLAGYPVWLDTSFTLTKVQHFTGNDTALPAWQPKQEQITSKQFLRLVRAFGMGHILFGSDSPWSSQADSIAALINSGIEKEALPAIFSENASKLLNLTDKEQA